VLLAAAAFERRSARLASLLLPSLFFCVDDLLGFTLYLLFVLGV
jgi:hypothetical protein